jgi:hypothetical protein
MSAGSTTHATSRRPGIIGAVCLALVASPSIARAQEASSSSPPPADATADEARRQFELGVEALRDERYADALTAFQASYRVRRAASVALDLGVTLRALGRLVEAREYLQEFLREASATQHAEHDQLVQTYLVDVNRRIGELSVQGDLPDDATLSIDSRRIVLATNGTVAVDPGDHTLVVRAHGYRVARQEFHMDPAARATVRVALEASAPSATTTRVLGASATPAQEPHPAHRDDVTPTYRNPWLWIGVGVVVVAAIVVPISIAAASGPRDPANTSTGVVLQGLSR